MAPAAARDVWTAELMETGGSLEQSGSEDEQLAHALRLQRPRWFSGKGPLFLAVVAVVLVVAVVVSSANREAPHEDVDASVQLFGIGRDELTRAASTLETGAKTMKNMKEVTTKLQNYSTSVFKPLGELKEQMNAKPGVSKLKANLTKMNNLSRDELLHPKTEDRHDGNVCADDEELHAALCYKKCSSLTGGRYPIRTTAWSCCMEEPCSFFNSKFTSLLAYCAGFDVSGNAEGKECPHAPGTCMENEEFSLGVCYKKCAILTNNAFPFRSAAATCCRYNNHLACLDALNTVTKPEFTVGGGLDDGHASTPNIMHPPMQRLTERGVPKGVDVGAYVAAGGLTA